MEAERKPVFVAYGDWYFDSFENFLNEEKKHETGKTSMELLLTPRFRVAETGESYRVINHWDTKGLLFDNPTRGEGWRSFSTTEMVWLRCMKELRGFGFSIDALLNLRRQIFFPSKEDYFTPKLFSLFIAKAIMKNDIILVVDKDGNGTICLEADYQASQIRYPLPCSYIIVSINKIYADIFERPEIAKKHQHLMMISKEEMAIYSGITFENVSEVRITAKDRKVNKIEMRRDMKDTKDPLSQVRNLIRDGKRKRVSLEVQDGKVVAIEELTKE